LHIIFLCDSFIQIKWNVRIKLNITMKNRSRYEVIAAILRSATKEETRTKIMYKAMLSNDQCKIYLDSLLHSGLIQEVNSINKMAYKITPKGNIFLSYYDQMKELLPVGIEENLTEEYYHLRT
jgi:predicted transcriptional regulator